MLNINKILLIFVTLNAYLRIIYQEVDETIRGVPI